MSDFRKGFFTATSKQGSGSQQQYEGTKKQLMLLQHQPWRKTEEIDEILPTLGGLEIYSFQINEHEVSHQSCTKPPGRGQETQQRKFQADRADKQWPLKYVQVKIANLEEGN